VDFFEILAETIKADHRLFFQLFELLGQRFGTTLAVIIIFGIKLVKIFFCHIVIGFVRIGEAVHDGGDHNLVGANVFAQLQNHVDGGR
jgi:hypothetical protein